MSLEFQTPTACNAEAGGNDGILKQIYRHVTEIKEDAMNQKANDYFSNLYNTNTEKPWFKPFYNCGQQDLNLHVGDTRT